MHDAHVHSNYSDGGFLREMVAVAETTDLTAVGFADHCYVSSRRPFTDTRAMVGMNFDRLYDRRRRAIEVLRDEVAIDVYDAVEMDYDPRDESEIRQFLTDADFEYAIGSVHRIEDVNVQVNDAFEGMTAGDCDRIVDRYYDHVVSLVETGLFDIVAHVDLPERTPALAGRATESHYRRVARALASSRTVPEINAGRALTDDGPIHPAEAFLSVLLERDVPFTIGSDAHEPSELRDRAAFLGQFVDRWGVDPISPLEVAEMAD